MQLCWNSEPQARPTAEQVHALLNHLHTSHQQSNEVSLDDGYSSNDFEDRWQRLKPNTIPKVDEHIAIIHAPSLSVASHFTGSEQDIEENPHTSINDSLSVDLETAVSRSSSILSDKDPLSVQIKSESLTNLHGSLEDVRNIYLNHSEQTIMECQHENLPDLDTSDSSDMKVDPWLKDIIAGSQDDVSYYRDVSDVIKNLDNILNSEKTSSSESSHQASPSRDNLTLDCKTDYPVQSCLVKSPGISNFQNILNLSPEHATENKELLNEDDSDREVIEPLNHSFERHSDTNSQVTLENLTPDTPQVDIKSFGENMFTKTEVIEKEQTPNEAISSAEIVKLEESNYRDVPNLKNLCLATVNDNISVSNKCEYKDSETNSQYTAWTKPMDDNIDENKCENDIEKVITDVEDISKPFETMAEVSDASTVYMDLINDTGSELLNSNKLDINFKDIVESCAVSCSDTIIAANESTVYLDLPAVIKETDKLLNEERLFCAQDINRELVTTSTPKSDNSNIGEHLENSNICSESKDDTTKIEEPNYGPGVTITKLDQKVVSEPFSPLDSPSKSHQTDTFDENSSVVLGPFENCTLDLFKGVKTSVTPTNDFIDMPKEELLTFSSNDIILETPSPLRDINFLIEVPDIDSNESPNTIESSVSKEVKPTVFLKEINNLDLPPLSPTTPPNSPGNFLSESPQHKFIIENLSDPLHEDLPEPIMDNDDDNQIELQITAKIAIAENENNLNLEYSGPINTDQTETFNEFIPESNCENEVLVGGNGGYFGVESQDRNVLEDSMQALRNELELKLPLAQVG